MTRETRRGVSSASWWPLTAATATAAVFAIFAALLFRGGVARHGEVPVPSLLVPYLTTGTVYLAACIWITLTLWSQPRDLHRRSFIEFASILGFSAPPAILLFLGLAPGHEGHEAVWAVNWYLFDSPSAEPADCASTLRMCFLYVAALGDLAAIVVSVAICAACQRCVRRACEADRVNEANAAVREFGRLITLASVLMVTMTLTVLLLFSAADQIRPPGMALLPASVAKPETERLHLTCHATALDSTTECDVVTRVAEPSRKPPARAPTLALSVGLSFTGVLFMLFFTCSWLIDGAYASLLAAAETAAKNATSYGEPGVPRFSVKVWREENGIVEDAATDRVLKAIALLAPALAGALPLIGA
jgi:hypothetical protein